MSYKDFHDYVACGSTSYHCHQLFDDDRRSWSRTSGITFSVTNFIINVFNQSRNTTQITVFIKKRIPYSHRHHILSLRKLVDRIKTFFSFYDPYHNGEQQSDCFIKQKYKYYYIIKLNILRHVTSSKVQRTKSLQAQQSQRRKGPCSHLFWVTLYTMLLSGWCITNYVMQYYYETLKLFISICQHKTKSDRTHLSFLLFFFCFYSRRWWSVLGILHTVKTEIIKYLSESLATLTMPTAVHPFLHDHNLICFIFFKY